MPILKGDYMRRVTSWLCKGVALCFLITAISAQENPDPTNLQVLPSGMSDEEVRKVMQTFTKALNVSCTYCHVKLPTEKFQLDLVSDEKDHKKVARLMMRMTNAINEEHLVGVGGSGIEVTCVTCHHGHRVPVRLDETLVDKLNESGTDSAIATYRSLREKYHGRAVYDFDERVLIEIGNKLKDAKDHEKALQFYLLNLEHFSRSYYTHVQTARVYRSLLDTTSALRHFGIALEIHPQTEWIKKSMAGLRK